MDALLLKRMLKPFRLRFFKLIALLNRFVLPKYSKADLNRLSFYDKMIIAYRYFITRNSLD